VTEGRVIQMSEYRIKWNLKHGGKLHKPGETITLSQKDAAPLRKSGVIVPVKKGKRTGNS